MTVLIGESYIPTDEEKTRTIALARMVAVVLDRNGPIPFQLGINAMIMVMASNLSAQKISNNDKIKLARGIGEAILANLVFEDVNNGDVH